MNLGSSPWEQHCGAEEFSTVNVQLFDLCREVAFHEFLTNISSSSRTMNGSTEDINALLHPHPPTSHNCSNETRFHLRSAPFCYRIAAIVTWTEKGRRKCFVLSPNIPPQILRSSFLNFQRKGLITNKCGTCGAAALPYVGDDSSRKVASSRKSFRW